MPKAKMGLSFKMNKIKQKLHITDPVHPGNFWKISKAGKVLEIWVIPDFEHAPDQYRLGVIQIGRVLEKILAYEMHSFSKLQLQLFPTIAEKQLAATIFWPELITSNLLSQSLDKPKLTFSSEALVEMAEQYNLTVCRRVDADNRPGFEHFDLLSTSNQPFIWIKLGQFIERFLRSFDTNTDISTNSIQYQSPGGEQAERSGGKKLYLQATLMLPCI